MRLRRAAALTLSTSAISVTMRAACRRGLRSGLAGVTVAAARATSPPITASVHRENAAPVAGTSSVTKMACTPACVVMSTPALSIVASDIAMTTMSATCQYPDPKTWMNRSPTNTPTATPMTTCTARSIRCPNDIPNVMTAAIGAKNGSWLPTR